MHIDLRMDAGLKDTILFCAPPKQYKTLLDCTLHGLLGGTALRCLAADVEQT